GRGANDGSAGVGDRTSGERHLTFAARWIAKVRRGVHSTVVIAVVEHLISVSGWPRDDAELILAVVAPAVVIAVNGDSAGVIRAARKPLDQLETGQSAGAAHEPHALDRRR